MNKKIKTLLPFALYEELQNMDQLDNKIWVFGRQKYALTSLT